MDTIYSIFGSPLGLAGFICGTVLLYLVISRTIKRRNDQ